jgi:hypothetical protein
MSPATDRRYTAPPPDLTRYKLLEIERKKLSPRAVEKGMRGTRVYRFVTAGAALLLCNNGLRV